MLGDHIVGFFRRNPTDSIARPGFMEKKLTGAPPLEWPDDAMISPWDYPEMMYREPRLAAMDRQGLEAVVIIPTAGLAVEWEFRHQIPALCANLRSFNRWVEEDWGFGADGRIFGVPMITMLDLDWAIAELERVVALGCRMVFLMVGPVADRSPADPLFDPWWARVQEMGVTPIFHVGDGGFTEMYGVHWGEEPHRKASQRSALQHFLCGGERAVEDTIAALVLHNLFGRFPDLKAISLENGSSWVGPLLRGIDKAARMGSAAPWLGGKLSDLPSDVFREHVYVSPYFEDDLVQLAELIGADRILFGSDWPHAEGVPQPLDFLKYVDGFSAEDTRTIMRDNAADLLGVAR
jgi:predicted TIM-barrel fold metal-dependent hydrolase